MDVLKNELTENFLRSMKNLNQAPTANERHIDSLFESALKLEEICQLENISPLKIFLPKINFNSDLNKPVDLLLESVIKNHDLDEHLTLYAINKYKLLCPKEKFSEFLEKLSAEVELRSHLFILNEDFTDVNMNPSYLNSFLCEAISSSDLKSWIQNALKSRTLVLLKAIKHGDFLNGQLLMDEMILCLESQLDLRLWFLILKDGNLDVVLDLCEIFDNFLNAIFNFFDKFADEIESNYDEELNIHYSHVNLDFEDFVKVFQLFLNKPTLKKKINRYLESNTLLTNKNFCFWIDVKSCL